MVWFEDDIGIVKTSFFDGYTVLVRVGEWVGCIDVRSCCFGFCTTYMLACCGCLSPIRMHILRPIAMEVMRARFCPGCGLVVVLLDVMLKDAVNEYLDVLRARYSRCLNAYCLYYTLPLDE